MFSGNRSQTQDIDSYSDFSSQSDGKQCCQGSNVSIQTTYNFFYRSAGWKSGMGSLYVVKAISLCQTSSNFESRIPMIHEIPQNSRCIEIRSSNPSDRLAQLWQLCVMNLFQTFNRNVIFISNNSKYTEVELSGEIISKMVKHCRLRVSFLCLADGIPRGQIPPRNKNIFQCRYWHIDFEWEITSTVKISNTDNFFYSNSFEENLE